jgi:hypothetical protein
MAEIQHFAFDKVGASLILGGHNTAEPSYHWRFEDDVDAATERPVYEPTQACGQASLAESFTVNSKAE